MYIYIYIYIYIVGLFRKKDDIFWPVDYGVPVPQYHADQKLMNQTFNLTETMLSISAKYFCEVSNVIRTITVISHMHSAISSN